MSHLHIVAFNVPWPANYGGVIDVFYRIKALSLQGVKIHLHTYTYGREPAQILENLCEEVCYYHRNMLPILHFSRRPFIVESRSSKELFERLCDDDYPILLEGVHNCYLLERFKDVDRQIFVRAHNVESDYYSQLAKSERRLLKKCYLYIEASKLRRYEPSIVRRADAVLAVTAADANVFKSGFGCEKVLLLPTFHPYDDFTSNLGLGTYALYHADLSVPENISAAKWLISNVFSNTRRKFVLAGRNPVQSLVSLVEKYDNVTLVSSPDDVTMDQLIHDAQVCVMITQQPTGLKLKLLNSLYGGRHCLVNSNMVAGTSLGDVCHVADTPTEFLDQLDVLMDRPFTLSDIENRRHSIDECYSNRINAQRLLEFLSMINQ